MIAILPNKFELRFEFSRPLLLLPIMLTSPPYTLLLHSWLSLSISLSVASFFATYNLTQALLWQGQARDSVRKNQGRGLFLFFWPTALLCNTYKMFKWWDKRIWLLGFEVVGCINGGQETKVLSPLFFLLYVCMCPPQMSLNLVGWQPFIFPFFMHWSIFYHRNLHAIY
jgi:hypothetical protein